MLFKTILQHKEQGLFNESSLGRVYKHTQNRNIGSITANRATNTPAKNAELNKELELSIRKNFGIIKVKGASLEDGKHVFENSFFVIGKEGDDSGNLFGFLKQEGEKYNQDSVLYKPFGDDHAYLIGLKDGVFPGLGVKHDSGIFHPNRAGEYFSLLKGKPFMFESIQFLNVKSFFSRTETEI